MTRKLFLNKFAKIQKSPIQIVDVGARSGLEDNLLFVAENTKTKILAFEPEPIEYSRLLSSKPPNLTLLNTALFSQSGNITLYVTKDPGLTSVYKPKFGYLKSIETEIAFKDYTISKEIKFDASTLDYEAKNNQFEQADFIKLDTLSRGTLTAFQLHIGEKQWKKIIKELTARELEAQKDDEPKEKKLDLNVE